MASKRLNILEISQQSRNIRHNRTFAQDRLTRLQAQLTLQQQQTQPNLKQVPLKVNIEELKNDSTDKSNNIPEIQQTQNKDTTENERQMRKVSNTNDVKLVDKGEKMANHSLSNTKNITSTCTSTTNKEKYDNIQTQSENINKKPVYQNEKYAKKRPHNSFDTKDQVIKMVKLTKPDMALKIVKNSLNSDHSTSCKKDLNCELSTLNRIAARLLNPTTKNQHKNEIINNTNLKIKNEYQNLENRPKTIINPGVKCNKPEIIPENNQLAAENNNNLIDKSEKNQHIPVTNNKDLISDKQKLNIGNKIISSLTSSIDKNLNSLKNNINLNFFNKNIKFNNNVQQNTPSTSHEYKITNSNNKNIPASINKIVGQSLTQQNKFKTINKSSVNNRLENFRQKLRAANALLSVNELKSLTTSKQIIPPCKTPLNSISTITTLSAKPSTATTVEPMDLDSNFEDNNNSSNELNDIKESTMSDFYDIVNENLIRICAEKNQSQQLIINNNNLYFVVDTNILLNNLAFIDDLIKLKFCETNGTIIFVPYIVLQELDKLKMRSKEGVSTLASRAIKFLNDKLESKKQNVLGQTSLDSSKNYIDIESPDDKIINCCLQLKMKNINFFLLSNDINLRNKAILNNINVSTKSDLLTKFLTKTDSLNNIR